MNESHMLTPITWCLGIVLALALPIAHVVHRLPVALASDVSLAIVQQLHIAREDDLHRAIDSAVALRQGLFRLGSDLIDGVTPGATHGMFEVWRRCLFPRDL